MNITLRQLLSITGWLVILLIGFSACDCDDELTEPGGDCLSSDDCPGSMECIDGTCASAEVNANAEPSEDCPEPIDCAEAGADCGPVPNGCGGAVQCGTCPDGYVCGSGDQRGECIEVSEDVCEPRTCDDYPEINCGQMPDGCGGLTEDCGECEEPEICGGSVLPSVCGADPAGDCEGLCADQAICSPEEPEDATTLTGTVYAPNGELPIPNAVVYIPNLDDIDDLPPVDRATSCVQCEEEELGDPLVATTTEYDGTFELRHVPVGVEFELVIKIGQWRRVVTIGPFERCEVHSLGAEDTRLPTRQHEDSPHDNIPKTAVSTGRVDAIECVLYQLGVDESEFTRHSEDGRIHMYRSNGGVPDAELANACGGGFGGVCGDTSCTDHNPGSCGSDADGDLLRDNLAHHLYESQSTLHSYDMVVMDCEGYDQSDQRGAGDLQRIKNYVDSGGRLFASHYAYDWLHNTDELEDTATWGGDGFGTYTLANVDISWPGGERFWDWLQLTGANYDNNHQIEVHDPRGYVQDIDHSLGERWVYTDAVTHQVNYDSVQQYTFDTPVYAPEREQCGQVAYSAFHVADVHIGGGPEFPTYCPSTMSAQEKVLAYMLFNLAACVPTGDEPPPPECTPMNCAQLGAECGVAADGCGGTIDCGGDCPDPLECGGNPNQPNLCAPPCSPLTCEEHDAECGDVDDGCGGTVYCGHCPIDERCIDNQCQCVPLNEECEHNAECCSEQCGHGDDGVSRCVLG